MTYKQIEASREVRLWIGQVIVPGVMLLGSALAIPEVRDAVATKVRSLKQSIEAKMKRKES